MEAHLEKDMTFNSIHKRFWRVQIFFENFIPPPPLKVNWIPLSTQFLTNLVPHRRQQIDTPPTHPCQNKRHSGLRMKMRPNQDVRGDAKKCASGYAMATPLAYARVYPEPFLTNCSCLKSMTGLLLPSFLGTVNMFESDWFSECSITSVAPFLSNFFISWSTNLSSHLKSLKGVGGCSLHGSAWSNSR